MVNEAKKILLVEDNEDCRTLLAVFIGCLGYEVFEASTGLQAMERAAAVRPDLILMDVCLPGMAGHEATACLKASPSTSHIPIIITTALVPGLHTNRGLAAGAAEVLYKPFELTKLKTVLRRYLPESSADSQGRETKELSSWAGRPRNASISVSPQAKNI